MTSYMISCKRETPGPSLHIKLKLCTLLSGFRHMRVSIILYESYSMIHTISSVAQNKSNDYTQIAAKTKCIVYSAAKI